MSPAKLQKQLRSELKQNPSLAFYSRQKSNILIYEHRLRLLNDMQPDQRRAALMRIFSGLKTDAFD